MCVYIWLVFDIKLIYWAYRFITCYFHLNIYCENGIK